MIYQYNGINMKMVKTNVVDFNSVLTEDRTTYLYTNYKIDIQAVVNPSTMSYIGGGGLDGNTPVPFPGLFPATTISAMRHALLQPRKLLIIKDEVNTGNILLQTPAAGFTTDVKNGPTPISCSLINISGARTALIRWVCEGWINECANLESGPNVPPYILSNRWTDQMVINQYQLTTRTFAGKTIFNKAYLVRDSENSGNLYPPSPDMYRNQPIFPNVANGFQRKTVDIIQNEAGDELTWRVVDEEMIWTLGDTTPSEQNPEGGGSGILEVDGKQMIASFKPEANSTALVGNTVNHIQLRAIGSYLSNQWVMIQRLLEIVSTLTPDLMVINEDVRTGYWVIDANISRSLGQKEKWVELNIQIMCPAPNAASGLLGNANVIPITSDIWNCIDQIIDQLQGTSPPLLNDNGTRGSATIPLLTQFLTESCQNQPDMPTVDSYMDFGPENPNNSSSIDKIPESDSNFTPGIPTKYDMNQRNYTACTIEMTQFNITGIKQIPITGPLPASGYGVNDPNHSFPGQSGSTATCGIVQLHLPMSRYKYSGIAERVGIFPTVPSPMSNNPDEFVLLSWHISPFYTAPGYDGITPVYRCDFVYEYAKVTGHDPMNPQIPIGKLPFSLIASKTFGSNVFSDQIINHNTDTSTAPPNPSG